MEQPFLVRGFSFLLAGNTDVAQAMIENAVLRCGLTFLAFGRRGDRDFRIVLPVLPRSHQGQILPFLRIEVHCCLDFSLPLFLRLMVIASNSHLFGSFDAQTQWHTY
jgi:hypothetical protein